jgi:hypothetical protein
MPEDRAGQDRISDKMGWRADRGARSKVERESEERVRLRRETAEELREA